MNRIPIPQIPMWLKKINPNSYLNARDLCELLGISDTTLQRRIEHGEMIEHSQTTRNPYGNRKRQWKVRDVLAFLERGIK